jgi:hypothetical protein
MVATGWRSFGPGLLALMAAPALAQAQIPTPSAPIPPAAPGSTQGAVVVVAAVIVLLLVVGLAVKLYDVKRKREDEGAVLQARLSDAVLQDPRLSGMSVVATVHMPLWRGAPPVIELSGTVSRPDARETALELVARELKGAPATIEDRIVVDPLIVRRVA